MEIQKFLVLSTAHIPAETAALLQDVVNTFWAPGHVRLTVMADEYRYVVQPWQLSDGVRAWWDQIPAERAARLQPLLGVFYLLHSEGLDGVIFDRDGDTLDGLPTYDW